MLRKSIFFTLLNSFACCLIVAGPAMAQNSPAGLLKNDGYLALGDSLPFGYNPLIQPPKLSAYYGYANLLSVLTLNKLTNASCPFETTGTFLTGGTTADGMFGCQYWRNTSGLKQPLFVSYSGPQIDYAASFLQSHPNVHLITIQLGGNDLGDLEITCNGDPTCELTNLPGTLADISTNLTTGIARIRSAGYNGEIVLVNYYAFNYSNAQQVAAFTALGSAIAAVAAAEPNVKLADSYRAFAAASAPFNGDTCAAGLRLRLKTLNPLTGDYCDVHPTLAGHALITTSVLLAK